MASTGKKKKASARNDSEYIHGFTKTEQDRLYRQARFHEPIVYSGIDLSKQKRIIEVGCGVGAQTEILLERFPHLVIKGVDASDKQLARAKKHLASDIRKSRVSLDRVNAESLPYEDDSFDGAVIFWLLEHVPDPVKILKEVYRTLKTGSRIYLTEVMNSSLYMHPYSPATLQYWFAFNDHQWSQKGDPFVGAKLGNYLAEAGFQRIQKKSIIWHLDNQAKKMKKEGISYYTDLMLSAAPGLIEAGKVDRELVSQMKKELQIVAEDPNSVFYDSAIQVVAEVH